MANTEAKLILRLQTVQPETDAHTSALVDLAEHLQDQVLASLVLIWS